MGLQVRNLKGGKRRFFVIYNWEHLYRWVNGQDVEIDLTKSVVYNKLSYFFNILNVNFEKKITLRYCLMKINNLAESEPSRYFPLIFNKLFLRSY